MIKYKLLQKLFLFCILILACHNSTDAESPFRDQHAANSPSPQSVFLRINEYYILYTNPVVPYVDPQGHLMVGLDGIKSILTFPKPKPRYPNDADRASLVEDAQAGTAVFSVAGHVLRFAAHSATALVDTEPIAMPTAAVLIGGHLVVPLSVLANGLGLEIAWDQSAKTVSVHGNGLGMDIDSALSYAEANGIPNPTQKEVIPWKLSLAPSARSQRHLIFSVKNVSTRDFDPGKVDIDTVITADGGSLCDAPFPSVDVHRPVPPSLAAGATESKSLEIDGPNTKGTHYVAALIMVY